MKEFDTIAAIATCQGEGGISIIRVSGKNSLKIANSIFVSKNGKDLSDMKSYTMRYGKIVTLNSREIIDEVIVSFMKGPKSFTTEDVIEINCHGGVMAANSILAEVIKTGARLAEPGEFTKRAFLNGRIDLSQAEAVIDIINAKTQLSMKSAVMQSEGKVSKKVRAIREKMLEVIAHIEATVDYPEDDLEEITSEEVSDTLKNISLELEKILNTADEGKILKEGLDTVIVGKPNVGKSSLLNALLDESRAIVTEVPGTTRDIIEEYISIDGIPIKIVDTAGIRETEDIVEKIGVEKTKKKVEEADLVILMLDTSESLTKEDREIINFIKDKKYIVLLNKSDLGSEIDKKFVKNLNTNYIIETSVKTGQGIDILKKNIKELFFNGEINTKDIYVSNQRQKEAFLRAKESVDSAINVLNQALSIDLASIDIRNAWTDLGEITGDTLNENIIDKIFKEFCLGK